MRALDGCRLGMDLAMAAGSHGGRQPWQPAMDLNDGGRWAPSMNERGRGEGGGRSGERRNLVCGQKLLQGDKDVRHDASHLI